MSSNINEGISSFFGKMLVVDLTSGKIEDRELPREWVYLYTGQKGLGSRILEYKW